MKFLSKKKGLTLSDIGLGVMIVVILAIVVGIPVFSKIMQTIRDNTCEGRTRFDIQKLILEAQDAGLSNAQTLGNPDKYFEMRDCVERVSSTKDGVLFVKFASSPDEEKISPDVKIYVSSEEGGIIVNNNPKNILFSSNPLKYQVRITKNKIEILNDLFVAVQ